MTYLWLGLPLFFVISGYCIAATADSNRRKSAGVAQYFYRRFKRIFPPLWICMAFFAVLIICIPNEFRPYEDVPHPARLSEINWIGNFTLTEEWRPNVGGPPATYLLGHSWTLCYEEQFYAVMGLLLLVSRRWFFPMVGLVTAWVYLNVIDVSSSLGVNTQVSAPGCFFDGMWLSFAAGVLVYCRLNAATPTIGRLLEAILLLGIFLSYRMNANPLDNSMSLAKFLLISTVFAWLLIRLRPLDSRLSAARILAPLRFCGQRCYSIYLMHGVLVVVAAYNLTRWGVASPLGVILVTVPVCLAIAIGAGHIFYCCVERRFLNSPLPERPRKENTLVDHSGANTIVQPPVRVLVPCET